MLASTNEVQNGEIFLSFEDSHPTPDNLFKLDHGIDGTHEDNRSDIARIHSCRKLLRCRENRGNGLLVICSSAVALIDNNEKEYPIFIVRYDVQYIPDRNFLI